MSEFADDLAREQYLIYLDLPPIKLSFAPFKCCDHFLESNEELLNCPYCGQNYDELTEVESTFENFHANVIPAYSRYTYFNTVVEKLIGDHLTVRVVLELRMKFKKILNAFYEIKTATFFRYGFLINKLLQSSHYEEARSITVPVRKKQSKISRSNDERLWKTLCSELKWELAVPVLGKTFQYFVLLEL